MAQTAYSYRSDQTVPDFDDSRPIIVFDGHCALCSGWVQFVLKHDTRKKFNFIVAQSSLGEALYAHYGLKSEDYDTNLLIAQGRVRKKSDGSLAMFTTLGGVWKGMALLRLVPTGLRDWVYDLIARNRIQWFGARDACYVPTAEIKARFL
ncbi:MAG: DCC1-like thiol-disulfide oxidoreductase family protein [Maricaulaceae bacterium]